jgi:hypothetical protein
VGSYRVGVDRDRAQRLDVGGAARRREQSERRDVAPVGADAAPYQPVLLGEAAAGAAEVADQYHIIKTFLKNHHTASIQFY